MGGWVANYGFTFSVGVGSIVGTAVGTGVGDGIGVGSGSFQSDPPDPILTVLLFAYLPSLEKAFA